MNGFVEKVISMAGSGDRIFQPSADDWKRTEDEVGIKLPSDLKFLVSTLGYGYFGELSLLNPVSPAKFTTFSRENLLEFKEGLNPILAEIGISLYPEPNGLLCIGHATNRMDLLLDIKPDDNYRLAWLEQDYRAIFYIEMPLAQFLHDFYLDQIDAAWAHQDRPLLWKPNDAFFSAQFQL